MSLLSRAKSGVNIKPQIYLIYGPNGAGKSTLASAFDSAIMLDLEDGSNFIAGMTRLTLNELPSLQKVEEVIKELVGAHEFKTLIIDSLESLETLIQKHLCEQHKVQSIEGIPFGKGFVMAREIMEDFMKLLQSLRDQKQMNIVLVAHSQSKVHTDPVSNTAYDRYTLRANEKLANVVKDLSDSIYFLTFKVETVSQTGKDKVKAYSSNQRVIHTRWSAGFDAKSRFPVDAEIAFDLNQVSDVVKKLIPSKPEDILAQIENLLPQIKDQATRERAKSSALENKNNLQKLVAIKQKLEELKG